MNNEQQQIIDEVYKNYFLIKSLEKGPFGVSGLILSKEEFINKIKTDPEFSEKWGLKIEERELSLSERTEYKKKRDCIVRTFAPYTHQMLDGSNIPTKLITVTYNDKTAESYE
jgi:hypothetical protein